MASMFAGETSPHDDSGVRLDAHSIERIARRVAEILRTEASGPTEKWLTAADVAARYSVSRAWVYDNAGLLGVVRLGAGTKARLRFDPVRVQKHFRDGDQQPETPRHQPSSQRRWVPESDLIPIRGH
jgi:hypothetical protein